MNRYKKVMAIIGIILLVALYISTLVFALIGSEDAMKLFRVSVYMTIVVPAFLWANVVVIKLLRKDDTSNDGKEDDTQGKE